MKGFLFAKRVWKEILRDPLSYIFCVLLPVVLMAVLNLAFYSEYTPWFAFRLLAPGISVFAGAFIMLSVSLVVSKDRKSSFLVRLYTSPMKTTDFVLGYSVPSVLLAVIQSLVCYGVADCILLLQNKTILPVLGTLKAVALSLPVMILFVFFGILLGSAFSENAAPGITSGVITAVGFLSAAWMPVEAGSTFEKICSLLPFYPSVVMARQAIAEESLTIGYLPQVLAYSVVMFFLAVILFKKQQTKE